MFRYSTASSGLNQYRRFNKNIPQRTLTWMTGAMCYFTSRTSLHEITKEQPYTRGRQKSLVLICSCVYLYYKWGEECWAEGWFWIKISGQKQEMAQWAVEVGRRSPGRWAASTTSPLFPYATSKGAQPASSLSPPFLCLWFPLTLRSILFSSFTKSLTRCDSVWEFAVGTSHQLPLQ